jgi:uncharacterized Zn-binding protein involved in type VI secretion
MGQPAAKQGDTITATDIHIVLVPSPGGPVPTPLPHVFAGTLTGRLSTNVRIMGRPAATVNSTATNTVPHLPMPPGTAFQRPPSNRGTVVSGSATVRINGRMAARNGDVATTCNDPADLPVGTVVAVGTVLVGP